MVNCLIYFFFVFSLQLCITLNNIHHVRRFLFELPNLLQWSIAASAVAMKHEEDDSVSRPHRYCTTVYKNNINYHKMQYKSLKHEICHRIM